MSEPTTPAERAVPTEQTAPDGPAGGREPRLFLLQGPPAVGKLTVAREIARRTGAIVVDNHLVNDAVFVPMGIGRDPELTIDQTDALRDRVRGVVHEATLAAPARFSHVFTFWLPDDPENAEQVERLRSVAARRGARFVPVWLTASSKALLARVGSASRAERAKLVDPEILRDLLEVPQLPVPSDAMTLDLSETGPEQAVEELLAALG